MLVTFGCSRASLFNVPIRAAGVKWEITLPYGEIATRQPLWLGCTVSITSSLRCVISHHNGPNHPKTGCRAIGSLFTVTDRFVISHILRMTYTHLCLCVDFGLFGKIAALVNFGYWALRMSASLVPMFSKVIASMPAPANGLTPGYVRLERFFEVQSKIPLTLSVAVIVVTEREI